MVYRLPTDDTSVSLRICNAPEVLRPEELAHFARWHWPCDCDPVLHFSPEDEALCRTLTFEHSVGCADG